MTTTGAQEFDKDGGQKILATIQIPGRNLREAAMATLRTALPVLDHAMQAHGAGGLPDDFGLVEVYAGMRALHIADGPDEFHLRSFARLEFRNHRERLEAFRFRASSAAPKTRKEKSNT